MKKVIDFLKGNWPILLILAVATFLRFYKLSSLPPGLYPDEAANGLDIIRMMDQGDFRVVYDTNGPRESLFFFLQGIFVWLGRTFDIGALHFTPLSLRIAPALIGVATVYGVYLLGKELANKNVGLFAAAAMAVSAWHIQFSRNGFRAIMLPFALSFAFYFFLRAYKEGKLKDYLWFAFFLALGFYTYLSIRMVPLIFMAFLVWTLVFDRKFIKNNFKKLVYTAVLFLVLMIPMFIHFARVPADILGRSSTSIFNPELNNGSAIKTLGSNIIKEKLMFNFSGDKNFRHNLGGSPMLDPILGIFFWVGAIISLISIKKLEHFTLLAWFGAMSLPMILTAEGIPHALRIVGAMPVIFIWIGLGLNFVVEKLKWNGVKTGFVAIVFLLASYFGYKKYFIDFPARVEAKDAYTEDMVEMAKDLKRGAPDRRNVLVTGEFGTKTIQYLIHDSGVSFEQFETYSIADNFKLNDGEETVIYVQPGWLSDAKREFEEVGITGEFEPYKSPLDGRTLFYVYKIER